MDLGTQDFFGQMRCLPIVKWTIPTDFERANPSRYAVLSLQCQVGQMHPSPLSPLAGSWVGHAMFPGIQETSGCRTGGNVNTELSHSLKCSAVITRR